MPSARCSRQACATLTGRRADTPSHALPHIHDLVVVLQPLLVFDLGDDLDVRASTAQALADRVDVRALAHERRGHHVDAVAQPEVDKVVAVLVGDRGQVDDDAGQVHVLLLANRHVVQDAHDDGRLAQLLHLRDERPVRDEHLRADLDTRRKGLVGARDAGRVAFDGVVGRDLEVLALDELDGLVVLEHARPDLGSLRVEHDADVAAWSLLLGRTHVAQGLGVALEVGQDDTGYSRSPHAHSRRHRHHRDTPRGPRG